MKKIIIYIFCILFFVPVVHYTSASTGSTISVSVTEKIPGANCKCAGNGCNETTNVCNAEGGNCSYKCEIQKGFGSLIGIIGNIIKYFTFLVLLAAVLFLVIGGIMYSMSGVDPSAKDKAKEKIIQAIFGIILLLLSGLILNLIAPWIYK